MSAEARATSGSGPASKKGGIILCNPLHKEPQAVR